MSPSPFKSLYMLDLWETGSFDLFFLLEADHRASPTRFSRNSFSWFSQIGTVNIQISYLTFICLGEVQIRGSEIRGAVPQRPKLSVIQKALDIRQRERLRNQRIYTLGTQLPTCALGTVQGSCALPGVEINLHGTEHRMHSSSCPGFQS